MPDSRSPISRMIDKACGVPEGWQPAPRVKPDMDTIGKAMVEVCELAVKWQKHGRRYEMRLSTAISNLKSLGF